MYNNTLKIIFMPLSGANIKYFAKQSIFTNSCPRILRTRVPQGENLSPILYLIQNKPRFSARNLKTFTTHSS